MQIPRSHIIRCVVAATVLSIVLSAAAAAGPDVGKPSEVGNAGSGRQPLMRPLDMLGIAGMQCNCSFIYAEDDSLWLFHSEPKIRSVYADGPSHGRLEKGDVIVAIDGILITTRQGGKAFTDLEPGKPVVLTVRRSGRTREATIVPLAIIGRSTIPEIPGEPAFVEVFGEPELAELAKSVEELSRSSAELASRVSTLELPDLPPGDLNIDFGQMLPKGWVGFRLSFHGSIKGEDPDKPAEWRFREPPSIESVQPGSPAAKAGLQPGDELLEIDGLKLDSRRGGDRFSRMQPGQVIEWTVRRGSKTLTVNTTATNRPAPEHAPGALVMPAPVESRPIRYTGSLAGAEIEVRGGEHVRVEVDEETGDIVIKTFDSVVRVKKKK